MGSACILGLRPHDQPHFLRTVLFYGEKCLGLGSPGSTSSETQEGLGSLQAAMRTHTPDPGVSTPLGWQSPCGSFSESREGSLGSLRTSEQAVFPPPLRGALRCFSDQGRLERSLTRWGLRPGQWSASLAPTPRQGTEVQPWPTTLPNFQTGTREQEATERATEVKEVLSPRGDTVLPHTCLLPVTEDSGDGQWRRVSTLT